MEVIEVHTNFDEKREDLRKLLKECNEVLDDMLSGRVYGIEDMKESYIDEMHELRLELYKIKTK